MQGVFGSPSGLWYANCDNNLAAPGVKCMTFFPNLYKINFHNITKDWLNFLNNQLRTPRLNYIDNQSVVSTTNIFGKFFIQLIMKAKLMTYMS